MYFKEGEKIMSAVSIRLEDDVLQRLSMLAKKTGRTKAFYIREAIQSHLEDLEDAYLSDVAIEGLGAGKDKVISSKEFWREMEDWVPKINR